MSFDIEKAFACRRVSRADKGQRDLLLYAAVETGWYTNAEIGLGLGLSGSAVSRRAAIVREALKADKVLNKQLNTIKSLIKV